MHFYQETCCLVLVLEIYRAILWTLNNVVYQPLVTLLSRDEYDNAEVVVVPLGCATVAICLQVEATLQQR